MSQQQPTGAAHQASDTPAAPGLMVFFVYAMQDEDDRVVSHFTFPLSFVHGHDPRIPQKVHDAVAGKKPGAVVDFSLEPGDAFGELDPALMISGALEELAEDLREVGKVISLPWQGGRRPFRLDRIEGGRAYLNGNHPLAGRTLKVTLQVLEVAPVPPLFVKPR